MLVKGATVLQIHIFLKLPFFLISGMELAEAYSIKQICMPCEFCIQIMLNLDVGKKGLIRGNHYALYHFPLSSESC